MNIQTKVVRKFLAAPKNVISPLIEYEGPLREVFILKKTWKWKFHLFHSIFFYGLPSNIDHPGHPQVSHSHGLVDTEF